MSVTKTFDQLLVEFEKLEADELVMFSGSITMPDKTFELFYKPLLVVAIDKKAKIRVGCATGCDYKIQMHCCLVNYFNVEVYVPSEAHSVAYLSEKFTKITVDGGFKKRDRAMQSGCKHFVGFFSQYAGAASGTAANAISIAAKQGKFGTECTALDGYAIVDFLRSLSFKFDEKLCTQVQEAENKTL